MEYMHTIPITDVLLVLANSTCPTGYGGFEDMVSLSTATDFMDSIEIHSDGLDVVMAVHVTIENLKFLDTMHVHILKLQEVVLQLLIQMIYHFKFGKEIKREGVTILNRPNMINGNCPSGYKVCGPICQIDNALCPLTSFYLTNQNTGILFDKDNKKYLFKERGGIGRPIVQFDLAYQYSKIVLGFPCRTKLKSRRETSTCVDETYEVDLRYPQFDTILEATLLKENGVPDVF